MSVERISLTQVMMLLVVSRLSQTLIFYGANPDIRQDVWWQSFLAALVTIPFAWMLNLLWQRFPDRTFPEMCTAVLGKIGGRMVTLLYAGFLFLTLTLTLRLTGEVFAFAFLPRTPIVVIIGVVAILAAWGAKAGIEVTARAAQVVFPIMIGSIVLIVLLLARDIAFTELWPPFLLHTGPWPHIADAFAVITRTLELIALGVAFPLIDERRRVLHAILVAQLWLGIIWIFVGVAIVGVLGPDYDPIYFPFFTVARVVSIADFLERVEGILLGVWLLGMFLRAGLFLWSTSVSTAHLLGVKDYRPLVIPLAALSVSYAIAQAESLVELERYLDLAVYTPFTAVFVLVVPLLILAVAALRGLRERPKPAAAAGWSPPTQ